MNDRNLTPRSGRGSRCDGVVSGYVFKIIRESLHRTQYELAECLGVDATTIQSWESGRRSLSAMKARDLTRLRMMLTRFGAEPRLFDVLTDAIEADVIISDAVAAGPQTLDARWHPLAASVHRRALTNLVTWPFTGVSPPQLRERVGASVVRRGPASPYPVVGATERARFFDHLLTAADAYRDLDKALLRRQAIYLLGFDDRTETVSWLAAEQRRAVNTVAHTDDVPSWIAVRSSAVALAHRGNPDPLHAYVANGLRTEGQDLANLNYWAYWVGEFPETYTDDSFMIAALPQAWAGARLLSHLLARLQIGSTQLELCVHTLWSLLATHPGLLHDSRLRASAQTTVEQVSSAADLSRQARQELASVAYAIRLACR